METSYRFTVSGRVQGVRYRQSAAEQARALGLRGWVCNRDDGTVQGYACGTEQTLEIFHRWLKQGPSLARVSQVVWEAAALEPHTVFEVRY